MTGVDKVLKATAFTWMMLIGLFGAAFVIGETLSDPGGWAAIVMIGSWLVPLAALAVLAILRPATAEPVFVVATVLVVVFALADARLDIIPRDDWGPVAAIAMFALGVALGFLGLHRPRLAGALLVVAGVAQVVAALLTRIDGEGPGPVLGGSSGVMILPMLVGGALFLLAGRHAGTPPDDRSQRHLSDARPQRS